MEAHPLDVVVMFPAFFETLTQVFDLLIEQGLEVYPQNGQWFWRWRAYQAEATSGVETMSEALAAALRFRLQVPSPATTTLLN